MAVAAKKTHKNTKNEFNKKQELEKTKFNKNLYYSAIDKPKTQRQHTKAPKIFWRQKPEINEYT